MPTPPSWTVSGSYFETCNCVAVCPCRRQNGKPGGRSTFGVCQFLLTWRVLDGVFGETGLTDRIVAMAGFYSDEEAGEPWRVILYIDDGATRPQHDALTSIFLGRAGGDVFFTASIAEVVAVRSAQISLDHARGRERVRIEDLAVATALGAADFKGLVSCGIPGHHHPGDELIASAALNDGPMKWSYEGRCGFATEFAHSG
ncbi:MAG TPA: DUF1326 domain-containing protein [Caulobacteraceae bacterium]